MKKRRIIIAGGGTGGHIYPGLAVAEELLIESNELEIYFLGTKGGLEARVVPSKNLPLLTIPVSGLNRVSWFKKFKSMVLLPISLIKSLFLLFKIRPKFVLGMGGYASGPFLLVASILGFRTAIWEINAKPGLTNRILSKVVDESWVVFDEAKKYLKSTTIRKVGMPVRKSIQPSDKAEETKNILIFGGSQGARGINLCASKLLQDPPDFMKDCQVRFQTGPLDFELVQERLKDIPFVRVSPYLEHIEEDYSWADIVICRAGASTLSELAAARKAAIVIPFPFAADDHQRVNAESLESKGACRVILQQDLTPKELGKEIKALLDSPEKRKALEKSIGELHIPGAASQMSKQIQELIR